MPPTEAAYLSLGLTLVMKRAPRQSSMGRSSTICSTQAIASASFSHEWSLESMKWPSLPTVYAR